MNDRQQGFANAAQYAEADARSYTSRGDAGSIPDPKSSSLNTTTTRPRFALQIAALIMLFLGVFSIGWFGGSKAFRTFGSNSENPGDPDLHSSLTKPGWRSWLRIGPISLKGEAK
jgi:hypothetical protein